MQPLIINDIDRQCFRNLPAARTAKRESSGTEVENPAHPFLINYEGVVQFMPVMLSVFELL
jgi:hypothetical protein